MPLNPSRSETGLFRRLIGAKGRSGLVALTQACFGWCARGLPGKHKRQAHRSTARRERTGSFRGDVFAAAAQRKSHSAPRRRIEKRRNSHSALSSLCSTNSQEPCSEAASALADPALTPSPRQARAALQGQVGSKVPHARGAAAAEGRAICVGKGGGGEARGAEQA